VYLNSATPVAEAAPLPATTDNQGKFAFRNIYDGTYRLRFEGPGYVTQAYGQKSFPGTGTPVVLTLGQAMKDFVMRLTPTGAVSGRIRDTAGKPLVAIRVLLMRATYDSNGQKTLQAVGSGRTDDRGDYRIFWTTPGRYYLIAGGPSSGPGAVTTSTDIGRNFPNELAEITAPVFYPNAGDTSAATVLEIKPGVETEGMNFTLKPQTLYRIRGRAIDPRTGKSPDRAQVAVSSPSLTGSAGRFQGLYDAATGTVEVRDLTPGTYTVIVTPQPDPASLRGGVLPSRDTATATIPVTNADVENIVWTVAPPFAIKGRITVDGAAPAAAPVLRVSLRPDIPGAVPQAEPPDSSGTITITNITPGDYRVQFTPPAPLYIKEIRLGGEDVLGKLLHFTGSDPGMMEVVLSSKGAQVTGSLTDDRLQPVPTSQVILVPDRLRDRVDLYKMARTDANGRFTFSNIPPGDYKVFAWETLDNYAWFDPDVLRQSEQKGKSVRLQESSRETVDVKIIPAGGL